MDLTAYIAQGEQEFRAVGATKPQGYASAPAYDAKLITWYLIYHTGKAPKAIRSSRGYTYNVTDGNGIKFKARITNYNDHRAGVVAIG